MADIQRDQVAFGQAISVTAIQEAAAIAGIVNGGVYNPPTVISQVTDSDGNTVDVDKREPRRVISAKASAQVRDLMQAVDGQRQRRRRTSSSTTTTSGGKTGTAQRADPELHRYKGYVTSFVGFAPLNDPEILTYVVLNNPQGKLRHRHQHGEPRLARRHEVRAAALLGHAGREEDAPRSARPGDGARCDEHRNVVVAASRDRARPRRTPPVPLRRRWCPAPPPSVAVSGVTLDTRLVEPGDLFVGLPGRHHHGAALRRRAPPRPGRSPC